VTQLLAVVTSNSGHKQVIITPTNAQITEMIEHIKANRLDISSIPIAHHPLTFARLQIAENEAEFSRQQDLYDHLSNAL
jgi:hypothetical protein